MVKAFSNVEPRRLLHERQQASKAPIRIVVADNHPIVRSGIVANLMQQWDMEIVAEANDGLRALTLIKKYLPDVVLLDLRMPRMDGLDVIAEINMLHLHTKVIVMTTFENPEDIQHSVKAGARAYLLKDCSQQILLEAIWRVHRGEVFLLPQIAQKLVNRMQQPQISSRELEVLEFLASGKSNKEIGVQLSISEGTVKTHVANLLIKLEVPGRTSAVREAVRRGLLELS